MKFNRLGSDGRDWVWKRKGEDISDRVVKPTVKFGGGSLMLWGYMTAKGVGYACRSNGCMDTELYVKILNKDLRGTLSDFDMEPEDIVFQQDNDPKYTSRAASEWLRDNNIEVLE